MSLGAVLGASCSAQANRGTASEKANGWIATIPFAADAGKLVLLPVRLNEGKQQRWVLDTGASECIIDRSAAKAAGLVSNGHREIRGTGKGRVRLDSIRSEVRLQLAGNALPTCEHFGAVDLSTAGPDGAPSIAGILGYEFFQRYIVRIDFAAREIRLYDPAKFRYSGSADTIRLALDRKQPRVAVRIRTARRPEVTRHLIVDTGSEDAVDDSTVRRSPNGTGVTVSTTGLGSSYEAVIGTLDTVRIGRSVFTNVPGVASDIGIVGNDIWSKFTCVFDYPHKRLFVESRPK
ncbi:MAG: pepsin/retropepsin-like aspartic protease family protein [Gemmatimonadaceae bacterium]